MPRKSLSTWILLSSVLVDVAACSKEEPLPSGDADVGDEDGDGGDGDGGDGDEGTDPNCSMLAVSEVRLEGDQWVWTPQSWGRGLSDQSERALGTFQSAPLVAGRVTTLGRLQDAPGEATEFVEGDADDDGAPDLFAHRAGSWVNDDRVLSSVGYFPGGSAPYVELFEVEPLPEYDFAYLPQVGHFSITDIDSDGDDDVVAAVDGAPWIYEQDGDGAFSVTQQNVPPAEGNFVTGWATLIDLNADGHDDYLSSISKWVYQEGEDIAFLAVWYADGSGAFIAPAMYAVGSRSSVVTHFAAGDFDGDGDVDVVVPYYPELLVFEGNADGSFAKVRTLMANVNNVANLTAADFDGDGRQDLAMWARDASYEDEIRVSLDPLSTASLEEWTHPRPGYSDVRDMSPTQDGRGLSVLEQVAWPAELEACQVACEDHADCATGDVCTLGLCEACSTGDSLGGAGGGPGVCD